MPAAATETSRSLLRTPSPFRCRCDKPSRTAPDPRPSGAPQPTDGSADSSTAHHVPLGQREQKFGARLALPLLVCAYFSHAATLGYSVSASGFSAPRITPQSVWPQTTTAPTRSTPTAYSIVADTPPTLSGYGGTILPITRQINNSPGLVCVSRQGSMRESAQVMNRASGRWPSASDSKRSRCPG